MWNTITNATAELQEAWQSLIDYWEVKATMAGVITFMVDLLTSQHAIFFYGFVALVALDVITKQMALTAQFIHATEEGMALQDVPTLRKLNYNEWERALRGGFVKSRLGRNQFIKKITLYFLVLISAKVVELFYPQVIPAGLLSMLVVNYLAFTEFMSVLENLRDGGNEALSPLIDLAKKKVFPKL